jgi:DNA-binding NarL/FixJ family response regulator
MVLTQQPDMVVCGEADSAAEGLTEIDKCHPQVAVVDLVLKESSGLELVKDIKIRHSKLPVLVLSVRDEAIYAERVLKAGARGYITKEEGPKKIVEGIRQVLAGKIYVSDHIASKVISKFADGQSQATGSSVDRLTDRELQVFELIGRGLPTKEIAQKLHLSPKTIDSYREHIKDKLKVRNSTELLKYAVQWMQGQQNS